jgi:hypothetical protein
MIANVYDVGLPLLDLLGAGRERFHDLVEQVAGAMTVGRRDGPGLTEAEVPELVRLVFPSLALSTLFTARKTGFLERLRRRDLFVLGSEAGLSVDEEDDDVGLLGCHEGLSTDRRLELGRHYRSRCRRCR